MTSPVFIHSSFRTSSTWIWSKFRDDRRALAYYECFNEYLAELTVQRVDELHAGTWSSRHPEVSPYFIEYLPLLQPAGGVAGFNETMATAYFFPYPGYDGALSEAETAYITRLVANAALQGRTPVICCTRTLGRLQALQRSAGGVHVVLVRKLLNQWNSYSGQARRGNRFFFNTILKTIALNRHERFIAVLAEFARARSDGRAGIQTAKLDDDDLFVLFVALHFYLYLRACHDADFVIRTSELAEPDYRGTVEDRLRELTGLDVSLGDAREVVDVPRRLLLDPERVRSETEAMCARALREVGDEPAAAAACRALLDELWTDEEIFRRGGRRGLKDQLARSRTVQRFQSFIRRGRDAGRPSAAAPGCTRR